MLLSRNARFLQFQQLMECATCDVALIAINYTSGHLQWSVLASSRETSRLSFLAGAARSHTPMSAIYLRSRVVDYNGKHISDIRAMR